MAVVNYEGFACLGERFSVVRTVEELQKLKDSMESESGIVIAIASYVGPCKQLAKSMSQNTEGIQRILDEFNMSLRYIDMDEVPSTSLEEVRSMGIERTPTVIIYKGGEIVDKIVGYKPFSFWERTLTQKS